MDLNSAKVLQRRFNIRGRHEIMMRELMTDLEEEQRSHAGTMKELRRCECSLKDLNAEVEKERKNTQHMQEQDEKTQQRIKTFKKQIETAEEQAAENLAKYRKAQMQLDEIKEANREQPWQMKPSSARLTREESFRPRRSVKSAGRIRHDYDPDAYVSSVMTSTTTTSHFGGWRSKLM